MPALKVQAGDFGLSYPQLQELKPYEFYVKVDHHPAIKIRSPSFLLKNPKRHFLLRNELKSLQHYVLDQSGVYRSVDHPAAEISSENNQYIEDYPPKTDKENSSSQNNHAKSYANSQTKTNLAGDGPKGIPAKYTL